MRIVSKILVVVAIAMLCATPLLAQVGQGAIHGKVLDRDGKPLQGAQLVVMAINSQDNTILSRIEAKTNKNGQYSLSGLYNGKYKVTLMGDGKPVMVRGEAVGDDIFVTDGRDASVNFDMRNAPASPPPPPAAAAAAPRGGGGGDRAANEAAPKGDSEMRNAFDAGRKAVEAVRAAEAAAATATGDTKRQQLETAAKSYDEAVKLFQTASEKDSKQHVIFAQMGLALTGQAAVMSDLRNPPAEVSKKYEDAAAAYQKAIEIKPDEPAYFSNRSLVLANSGKIDEAIADAQKATTLNPQLAGQSYFNLGLILTRSGKAKESIDVFKKSIEIDPQNAKAFYQLGIAYFGATETIPLAVTAFETFLKLQPTGPDADAAKQFIEAAKAQAPTKANTKGK
jgi:cytochrome c-type biogenesis protein CcmH/NrfG